MYELHRGCVWLICQSTFGDCSLVDGRKTNESSQTKKQLSYQPMTGRFKIMELVLFRDTSKKQTFKMFLRLSADNSDSWQGDSWFMILGWWEWSLCILWLEGWSMTHVCGVPQILDWSDWSNWCDWSDWCDWSYWICRPLRTGQILWLSVKSLKPSLASWHGPQPSLIKLSFCVFIIWCAAGRFDLCGQRVLHCGFGTMLHF